MPTVIVRLSAITWLEWTARVMMPIRPSITSPSTVYARSQVVAYRKLGMRVGFRLGDWWPTSPAARAVRQCTTCPPGHELIVPVSPPRKAIARSGRHHGTNLPGPMFCWYVRNTYLENNLRKPGKTVQCGVPIDLSQIYVPAFVYASRDDHIVPWKTAFTSREILSGDVTFVLGASGHIAGVINPPAKNKRNYWADAPALATPTAGSRRRKAFPGAGGRAGPRGSRSTRGPT